MKLKNFLFFSASLLLAQAQPICRIINFSTNVKGISFGPTNTTEHCFIWLKSPAPNQIQIACYTSTNQILHNEISTPTNGMSGSWIFPDGAISWLITFNNLQVVGAGSDHIEVTKSWTF
jgi:hypothetical protein